MSRILYAIYPQEHDKAPKYEGELFMPEGASDIYQASETALANHNVPDGEWLVTLYYTASKAHRLLRYKVEHVQPSFKVLH